VPLLSTLVDDYSTNTLAANYPQSYGTVAITGGRAEVTTDTTTGHGLQTDDAYTFDLLIFRAGPPPAGGGVTEARVVVKFENPAVAGQSIGFVFDRAEDFVRCHIETSYWDSSADATETAYSSYADPDDIRWRLSLSGATLTWEWSPTGYDSWTTLRTATAPAWLASTTTGYVTVAGHVDAGSAVVAWIDDLGVVPEAPDPEPEPEPGPPATGGAIVGLEGSIPVPIGVRLRTSRRELHIARELGDVRTRAAIPGGFASATIALHRPLHFTPDELAHYAEMTVYDTRHGGVVWDGRVEDLGRGAGPDGTVWDIAAIGAAGHARDQETPSVFISTDMTEAIPTPSSRTTASIGPAALPIAGLNGVKIHAARGEVWPVGNHGSIGFFRIADCGQDLASFKYFWETGGNSINWKIRGLTFGDASPSGFLATEDQMVAGTTWSIRGVIGSEFPTGGDTTLVLRLYRDVTAANPVPDDLAWVIFAGAILRAVLYDRSGNPITSAGAYANDYVTSDEVVIDQLGRFLNQYDGPGATITAGVHHIDHLSYPDGVTPAKVFEDLMKLDPYYWAAWERGSDGRHRFEWIPWPEIVRYEVDVTDGFEAPSSAADLRNRVHMRWKDSTGRIRRTSVNADVPALTAAGLTRSETEDLGDEVGSAANATQAGTQWLSERAYPVNAGRITIARPVFDLVTGRYVLPHEIRPGWLLRVRGTQPTPDNLNATSRDGATVFRMISTDYSARSSAVDVGLDAFPTSTARQLAELRNAPLTRARRR
jgi:hypothetical protein